MTRRRLPVALTLTDGAMAADGGSVGLRATDQDGARVEFLFDWSIASRRAGTTQFYVNGLPIPRGGPEEAGWLALLHGARIEPFREAPASKEPQESDTSAEGGADAALAHLAAHLVSLVSSAPYQEDHAPAESQPPSDPVSSLLTEGKTLEAIRAYREAHPNIGLMDARCAVTRMAAELEQAAQQAATPDEDDLS